MKSFVVLLLTSFDWFVLGYFVVLNTITLILVMIAAAATMRSLRRPSEQQREDIFANPLTPPISVVMGARNEEMSIVQCVRAYLGLRYPEHELVVVDDGSTDETFERLRDEFDLVETVPAIEDDVPFIGAVTSMHVPRSGESLVVLRKINAGTRADALNAGINAARHPLVCCVDADSIFDRDALLRVAKPFVDDPQRVIATGGTISAVNGSIVHAGQLTSIRQPRQWLARLQIIEYLRSFLIGRTGWSRVGGLIIVSGAFGLFRRDVLVEVGGFDPESLAEDADVIISFHRAKRLEGTDYRIVFVPDAVCWTEVPQTREVLGRQRRRWAQGLAQVLTKRRDMIGNPRFGRIGTVALPYYFAFELLGPIVELVGLVAVIAGLYFGVVSVNFALLFAAVAFLYSAVVTLAALLVEQLAYHRYPRWRDLGIAMAATVIENLGYRQLNAWWRLRGLYSAVRGQKTPWGDMTRAGFTTEVES